MSSAYRNYFSLGVRKLEEAVFLHRQHDKAGRTILSQVRYVCVHETTETNSNSSVRSLFNTNKNLRTITVLLLRAIPGVEPWQTKGYPRLGHFE